MASAVIRQEKLARVTAAGTRLDPRFAAEVGAWGKCIARLRVLGVEGSPTGGSVVIGLYHAVDNLADQYGAVTHEGATHLTFTIPGTATVGQVFFSDSEWFARFLIWNVNSFAWTGGAGYALSFAIDLVMKD